MNDPTTYIPHRYAATKILGVGVLSAILTSLLILFVQISNYNSCFDTFNEIKLGMPRDKVESILKEHQKAYTSVTPNPTGMERYQFSDFGEFMI